MKAITVICFLYLTLPLALPLPISTSYFPGMSAPELIQFWGYDVEEHDVSTKDGYILGVHRIPQGKHERQNGSKPKPVAFLAHGLTANSGVYVFGPPEKSLGYILADAGFDVWMGNTRGNRYSRRHMELNPCSTCKAFWDFGFDDTGVHDFSAEIDYIMEWTGANQVHFVGHSMGASQLVVLLSEVPEYNDKIAGAYFLAPAVYMNNVKTPLAFMSKWSEIFEEWYHHLTGFYEHLPGFSFIQWLGVKLCSEENIIARKKCAIFSFFFNGIYGINESNVNKTMAPIYLDHIPDGTSIRPFAHYGQLTLGKNIFKKCHLGSSEENVNRYGFEAPPVYNVSKVTTPVALFVGDEDVLSTVEDVKNLATNLHNVSLFEVLEGYQHTDFMVALNADKLIYAKILEMMQATLIAKPSK